MLPKDCHTFSQNCIERPCTSCPCPCPQTVHAASGRISELAAAGPSSGAHLRSPPSLGMPRRAPSRRSTSNSVVPSGAAASLALAAADSVASASGRSSGGGGGGPGAGAGIALVIGGAALTSVTGSSPLSAGSVRRMPPAAARVASIDAVGGGFDASGGVSAMRRSLMRRIGTAAGGGRGHSLSSARAPFAGMGETDDEGVAGSGVTSGGAAGLGGVGSAGTSQQPQLQSGQGAGPLLRTAQSPALGRVGVPQAYTHADRSVPQHPSSRITGSTFPSAPAATVSSVAAAPGGASASPAAAVDAAALPDAADAGGDVVMAMDAASAFGGISAAAAAVSPAAVAATAGEEGLNADFDVAFARGGASAAFPSVGMPSGPSHPSAAAVAVTVHSVAATGRGNASATSSGLQAEGLWRRGSRVRRRAGAMLRGLPGFVFGGGSGSSFGGGGGGGGTPAGSCTGSIIRTGGASPVYSSRSGASRSSRGRHGRRLLEALLMDASGGGGGGGGSPARAGGEPLLGGGYVSSSGPVSESVGDGSSLYGGGGAATAAAAAWPDAAGGGGVGLRLWTLASPLAPRARQMAAAAAAVVAAWEAASPRMTQYTGEGPFTPRALTTAPSIDVNAGSFASTSVVDWSRPDSSVLPDRVRTAVGGSTGGGGGGAVSRTTAASSARTLGGGGLSSAGGAASSLGGQAGSFYGAMPPAPPQPASLPAVHERVASPLVGAAAAVMAAPPTRSVSSLGARVPMRARAAASYGGGAAAGFGGYGAPPPATQSEHCADSPVPSLCHSGASSSSITSSALDPLQQQQQQQSQQAMAAAVAPAAAPAPAPAAAPAAAVSAWSMLLRRGMRPWSGSRLRVSRFGREPLPSAAGPQQGSGAVAEASEGAAASPSATGSSASVSARSGSFGERRRSP